LSPHQLSWLLSVVQQSLAFRVGEGDRLSIAADESHTVTRVDSVFGKSAKFGSTRKKKRKRRKKLNQASGDKVISNTEFQQKVQKI
jgi:hypothetical protein